MKSLVVLYAGEITGYAHAPFGGGLSAFQRCLSVAASFPDVSRVLICTAVSGSAAPDEQSITAFYKAAPLSVSVVAREQWTATELFTVIECTAEDCSQVFFMWADTPFIDPVFTQQLFSQHTKYSAEYTFADGYPAGLAPEILARGMLPILTELSKKIDGPVQRDTIFSVIKTDINSFDIETDIAPVDVRQLRLVFSCDTRRNLLLCESFDGIDVANYSLLVGERGKALRMLPSFYAIQVSGRCPFSCNYCPYPGYCVSGVHGSPGVPATSRTDVMSVQDFSNLIKKIAEFSDDAVVSLSLWGEPSFHPDISALVDAVLEYPGLSVMIETTGIGWDSSVLEKIAQSAARHAPCRKIPPVYWIVSLDAVGSGCYAQTHGIADTTTADTLLREALKCTETLISLFPNSVWQQMLRMNMNETELESFYRFWKQKTGMAIIQKHDHFCHTIPDHRVADLSPLVRNPCWHLKRDMCIMIDGTVPLCREDLYGSYSSGNAFKDTLTDIWEKPGSVYTQHLLCNYEGLCGACDEYYTYNF